MAPNLLWPPDKTIMMEEKIEKNCLFYAIWLDSAQVMCIQEFTDITSGGKYSNFESEIRLGLVSSLYLSNRGQANFQIIKKGGNKLKVN